MRRLWILLALIAIVTATLSVPGRTNSLSTVVAANKKCHYVTKKVHGKKMRVKVCKKAPATPTPTATMPPTATPTPVPTAVLYPTVANDLTAGYEKIYQPNGSAQKLPDGSVEFSFNSPAHGVQFSLTPHHYLINSNEFAVRLDFSADNPDATSLLATEIALFSGDPNTRDSQNHGPDYLNIHGGSGEKYKGIYLISYYDNTMPEGSQQPPIKIDFNAHLKGIELRFVRNGSSTNITIIDIATGAVLGNGTLPFVYNNLYPIIELSILNGNPSHGDMTVKKLEIGAKSESDVLEKSS